MLEKTVGKISMDGWGRLYEDIIVERLWRTMKYEEVYFSDYTLLQVAKKSLRGYFGFL